MDGMKLSKYFEIVKPTYAYLKLIPDTSIRNYNSSAIAKMVANMYQGINKRIYKYEKKYYFKSAMRCSYFIDIKKNDVSFYFIVPQQYEVLAKEKIRSVWPKITIENSTSIEEFKGDRVSYQLSYKKEDALSLNVDTRSNTLLNSILNVIDIMEEGDRVGIFYNFVPVNQQYWKADYKNTIDKWKEHKPLERNKITAGYILKYSAICLLSLVQSVLDGIREMLGDNKGESKLDLLTDALNRTHIELSECTKKKKNEVVIDTQIAVLGSGPNLTRSKSNVIATCQSFNSIEGDNELIYKENKRIECVNTDGIYLNADRNKLSTSECQNLLQLPGRELLEKHKINHINTLETPVPKELQNGSMCIGSVTYRGENQKAYLSIDKSFKNLTLVLIGPTRAGKTTLISNLCIDAANNGEVNVIFDWCGNCELSRDVKDILDKRHIKYLEVDCSDLDNLQGMGYNELYYTGTSVSERYRSAKMQSSQLMALVNSLQVEGGDLQPRMERYLEAAAVIVFINNGAIKDVFNILQRHELRHSFIERVPNDQKDNCEDYIEALKELDDLNKEKEIVGTKISNVQGILNRANKLKQNTHLELMLKKDCKNNFNLTDEIQKSQTIFIKMPEIMFMTEVEKDIYATYWTTKLWSALQQRKWFTPDKMLKVNMFYDELYQTKNCQQFLTEKLSQIAKFEAKPIISCHYLEQIKYIRSELRSANASYMLIAGCDKENYKELKEELSPFELQDLLNLKRYHSLNLIKKNDGYARFISKLPAPL